MARTGVKGLDQILGGGIPQHTNLLLYGEPLCGKKSLAMQYIYEGLVAGVPGIFVLTDYGYLDWKAKMAASGWDIAPFESSGLVRIVDCYTRQFEPAVPDEGVVSYADSPAALSSISLHLSRVQAEVIQSYPTHRLVVHSLSSILKESDSPTFYRFMQFIVGKFRRDGATAMYLVERGMHDEKDVKMVEHLMDGVIEFQDGRLRVRGLRQASADWHEYRLSAAGMSVKP